MNKTTTFFTFLCRLCTTTTRNCLISRFFEDVNTTQLLNFFFLNFDTVSRNIVSIWQIERDGISAIKFQAARLHSLIDWRFRSHRRRCCLRQSSLLIQIDSDNEVGTDSYLVSRTNSSFENLKRESSSQSDRESFWQNVFCAVWQKPEIS